MAAPVPNSISLIFLYRINGAVRVCADTSDTATAHKAEDTCIVTGTTIKTTGFTTIDGPGDLAQTSAATARSVFLRNNSSFP